MATFLDLKLRFREASGRYDLIDSDGTVLTLGGDRFIHSGIKYLEDRVDTPVAWQPVTVTAEAGSDTRKIIECSVVKSFFVCDSNGDYTELEAIPYGLLLEWKTDSSDTGTPSYYCIIPSSKYYKVTAGNPGVYVEIYPSPDATYTYSAIGRLYSAQMTQNTDENFWSVYYPELAVWAACYQLEVLYRNTTGANDWLAQINEALRGVDAIGVEQSMPISVIMGG